jgi:asparagine synthase (glutamine-hydrolysing)
LEVKKYTTQPEVDLNQENIELYELIVRTFEKAVEERLMSDRPVGCLLSGGLDSSLVASVAANLLRERGKELRTFSIGMKEGTVIIYAREVAKHIGSNHTEFIY